MDKGIVLIVEPISIATLKQMAKGQFGDMVKAVVDVELRLLAVGAELHSDEEACLMDHGSEQRDLWGINIYPDVSLPDRVEFDSMINLRPSQGNRSRSVEDAGLQARIIEIVLALILDDLP